MVSRCHCHDTELLMPWQCDTVTVLGLGSTKKWELRREAVLGSTARGHSSERSTYVSKMFLWEIMSNWIYSESKLIVQRTQYVNQPIFRWHTSVWRGHWQTAAWAPWAGRRSRAGSCGRWRTSRVAGFRSTAPADAAGRTASDTRRFGRLLKNDTLYNADIILLRQTITYLFKLILHSIPAAEQQILRHITYS